MKNTKKSSALYRENVHWDFRREVHYPVTAFFYHNTNWEKGMKKKNWLNAVYGNGNLWWD